MAALANELPRIDAGGHTYNADAFAFSASLQQPVQKAIEKQAAVKLLPTGGYEYKPAEPRQIEGIVSHRGGYAQVGGHASSTGGMITFATAVVEHLNILDVLTVDRVVAQITTEHAPNNLVPSVSFLGTRFENLRIAGQRIEIDPYHDILGAKPDNDESYLENGGVLSRIAQQYSKIRSMVGLPKWASDQFQWDPMATDRQQVKCSLVKSVSGAPGKSFGHVIDLPFFGKIFLAELTVTRVVKSAPVKTEPAGLRLEASGADASNSSSTGYQFTLTMLNAQLNGGASGQVRAAEADPNGVNKPPLPPPTGPS
jgi:hypothetical protein